jgi:hypothetical protein
MGGDGLHDETVTFVRHLAVVGGVLQGKPSKKKT